MFSSEAEAEYLRSQLLGNRTLIRVACLLAVLLSMLRGAELLLGASWAQAFPLSVALILITSVVLSAVAWTRAFERFYLPLAKVLVPFRNTIAAVFIAGSAANGQLEMLMLLALMVLGPFFFLGLPFRAALLSVALTVAGFITSGVAFELELAVMLRACVLTLMIAVAGGIAARHLETWSRRSFLESRLIAELAQHDALTGLKNRRVFDEHMSRLWEQAANDGCTLAILLIDVDHFKPYNDLYGHQAGDLALQEVARTLQRFVTRPLDVVARYGGEEFAVILYDVDARRAKALGDRVRLAVSELALEHRASRVHPCVTISVGIAVVEPSPDRRAHGAFQLADQALYEAKQRGRNRVELMDQSAHGQLVTGVFSKISVAGLQ